MLTTPRLGAQHVAESNPMIGRLLSYLIAGHHAGLADGIAAGMGSLENRLKKPIPEYQEECTDVAVRCQCYSPAS